MIERNKVFVMIYPPWATKRGGIIRLEQLRLELVERIIGFYIRNIISWGPCEGDTRYTYRPIELSDVV